MDGFEEPDGRVPEPLITIEDQTRDQLKLVVAGIMLGHTPEQIVEGLSRGFEPRVTEHLDQELEDAEASAHVDVMLALLQAPSPFAQV